MKIPVPVPQIMEYLASFTAPGESSLERQEYCNFCMDRLLRTFEMVPETIKASSRVLELGASPYFMSLYMRRYMPCQLELTNCYGDSRNVKKAREVLESRQFGEKQVFDFRMVNVENEVFPFKDETFDLVFFCEVIEHLTTDPIHALVQINRVLKKDGWMIITTPNVLRYENVAKLITGKNIYGHYSGYGAYGRHNREYTPEELRILVEALGFRVERLFTRVTGSMHIEGFSIKKYRRLIQALTTANRGSVIYLLARKTEEARPLYPEWLFTSIQNIKQAQGR